ncbi:hypothetical protein [Paenibacillus ehimensis]|uniref:Uncharacterized protein n=1 Tax=Paenibacillus ehimensis TaxID=79264 RepID=A0ABT8V3D0_9BACL|nr:hypothetical protein [Paenibacillus ehimensis]MDO3675929.1 hypothetical protein [Paenibacillus ehimensis]
MSINSYLDKLEGTSKRHVLLIVTPKEKYPNQYLDETYYELEKSILEKPRSYISVYGDDPNEVMQFVAFREYIRPEFTDRYLLREDRTNKVKRMDEKELISFIVAKHFYDTVPYGEKKEEEAIKDGEVQANQFLEKYPLSRFEHASVVLGKDTKEANVLIKLNFTNLSDNYYFDYVYVR